jgi:lipopolysaccharide export system protein LptA
MVTFSGNVVAKQEDTTLYTNMLVIYYHPDTKKLREMVATGSVKIVQLDRRATSQKATFYQDVNKIVLEGDVVMHDAESVVRGDRITYYIDEERSIVEAGKGGRVSTHITPSSKEK